MLRGTPRAYATDHKALEVAERTVDKGFDRGLPPDQRPFIYLPFSHSERLADQLRAVAVFEAASLDEALVYVRGHLAIIRRFGRFRIGMPFSVARACQKRSRFSHGIQKTMAKAPSDRAAEPYALRMVHAPSWGRSAEFLLAMASSRAGRWNTGSGHGSAALVATGDHLPRSGRPRAAAGRRNK
jgi:hypothetical protein